MRNRSRFGGIELIEGILLIILGIFSFLRPDSMLSGFVMFFGLIALCIGILDIIFYVRTEEHIGFAPTIALISSSFANFHFPNSASLNNSVDAYAENSPDNVLKVKIKFVKLFTAAIGSSAA